MSQGVQNKVVVITGASSGLGAETARHLSAAGANVVLGARRVERLETLAKELNLHDQSIMKTDVTDRSQVSALVDRAVKLHGRIDVLLNDAGLMPSSMLDKLKVDEWDRMNDVNIKGVLYGIAAALPHMQSQKSGQIINVSSVAGHKVGPGGSVYAGTKWAVRAISEGMRQEVKPWNIRTTIVSPGAVATGLIDTITDEDIAAGMAKTHEQAIPASSFARVVEFAISQPEDIDINEVLFRPTSQAIDVATIRDEPFSLFSHLTMELSLCLTSSSKLGQEKRRNRNSNSLTPLRKA
ncbi:oxidoreductase [Caballeronia arvi]|uniref:Oxidoreductase n=1 Tax=Caballeronia arvi TaxID=1777135 RepID=A0A158L0S5_9BURK|nr:oxidoreductase [Caballeronia arvi]